MVEAAGATTTTSVGKAVTLENLETTGESGVFQFCFQVPLLWVMKGSYFGFGSPQQQADIHARSKNIHFIICIYFDLICSMTQTICSTINFSKR